MAFGRYTRVVPVTGAPYPTGGGDFDGCNLQFAACRLLLNYFCPFIINTIIIAIIIMIVVIVTMST